ERAAWIYGNRDDAALAMSAYLHRGQARVGQLPAPICEYETNWTLVEFAARSADPAGHSYYWASLEMLRQLAHLLAGDEAAARGALRAADDCGRALRLERDCDGYLDCAARQE